MLTRLGLGTAQFGLNYGIANKRGQTEASEAHAILGHAQRCGLDTLDTAMAYGESESRLGAAGVRDWRVVSKLSAVPTECNDIAGWVSAAVFGSCERLKVPALYGLLLHDSTQLLQPCGDEIFRALERLRDSGLVKKIGVSIYAPAELDALASRFRFDLIQAPFNVLDQRLARTGWLSRLSKLGTEIHARSVFLQGLLLFRPSERPTKFDRWNPLWDAYEHWLGMAGLTPLQACLRHVLSVEQVDRVIVGVDSLLQLKEIFDAAEGPVPVVPASLATNDTDLLNPSRWSTLSTPATGY